MTRGQIGYEAYARCTGGRTWDDKPMPTWFQLPTRTQDAWEAAGQAQVADCLAPGGEINLECPSCGYDVRHTWEAP